MANEDDIFEKYKLAPLPKQDERPIPTSEEDVIKRYDLKPIYPRGSEVEGPPMPPRDPNYGRAAASSVMYGASAIPGQFGDLNIINELPAYGAYGVNAAMDLVRDKYLNKDKQPVYPRTPETEKTKEAINQWGEDWQKGAERLRYMNPVNLAYQFMVPKEAKDWVQEKTGIRSLIAPKTDEIGAVVQPYAEKAFGVGPMTEFKDPDEKLIKEMGSFGTQAIGGPGKLFQKVVSGLGAGGLGEYLRQNAEGKWYEVPAQIAGNIIGGYAPQKLKAAAQTVLTPTELAKERIGQVAQNYSVESTRPVQAMAHQANIREMADKIPDRFTDFTRQLTGMKGDLPSIAQLTEEAGQAERRRIFGVINNKPEARNIDTSKFADILNLPQVKDAMKEADVIAQKAPWFGIVTPGENGGGNLAYWHQVKRNLGEALDRNARSVERMSATEANLLAKPKAELEQALFANVPGYKDAIETASHTFQSTNAPMAGMEFMKNVNVFDKKDIMDAMQRYTPEQRKLFNAGVLQTLDDEIRNKNNGLQAVSRKFLDNREFNDKLRAAMGDADYSALRGKILSENMISEAAKYATKHDITAKKMELPTGKIGALTTAGTTAAWNLDQILQLAQSYNVSPQSLGLGVLAMGGSWAANKTRDIADKRIAGRMINLIEKNDVKAYREMDELTRKRPDIYAAFVLPGTATQTEKNLEDREERATGGKVVGSIAQRLVANAEKAHKYHQKTTEEILDAPDEAVVKALAVAKKSI